MSFGSDMGRTLTFSNEFEAQLIIDGDEERSIEFDSFEFGYIEGYQLRIRLGLQDNPGSKNELTLEADGDGAQHPFRLTLDKTYVIGPGDGHIHATFGLENHIEYLPSAYWGDLSVTSISSDAANNTFVDLRFSIGWESDDGKDMKVDCTTLKTSTSS